MRVLLSAGLRVQTFSSTEDSLDNEDFGDKAIRPPEVPDNELLMIREPAAFDIDATSSKKPNKRR